MDKLPRAVAVAMNPYRLGSIEPGKLADLVLVRGDPSQNIRALCEVAHVMLNGHWID